MDLGPTVGGASMELTAARLTAMFGHCPHPNALPVDVIMTGDVVAWLCPDCDTQLPADWRNPLDVLKKPGAGC